MRMETKKIVMFGALCLGLACATAHASESTFSTSGSMRIRAEGNDFTDYSSNRDFFTIRIRPSFKWEKGSKEQGNLFSVVLTPQAIKTFGEAQYSIPLATGVAVKTPTSGAVTDPNFLVHEAYLMYSPSDALTLKGGRMVYSYGDELVMGASDWGLMGRSFDGFNARIRYGIGWSDLLINKIQDNNTVAPTSGDVNLFGIYNSVNLGDSLKALDLYFMLQNNASTAPTTNLSLVGARAASTISDFDYRAEVTKEFGSAFTSPGSAYQANLEAGYKFQDLNRLRIAGEFFTAGKSYSQFYSTAHKFLGYADVVSRANLTGFAAHLSAQVFEPTLLKLDYHYFGATDKTSPVYKINGTTPLLASTPSGSIGSEVDLSASHRLTQDLSLTGGACVFFAGKDLKSVSNKTPVFYYTAIEAKF